MQDGPVREFDDEATRLHIELRLARFRLEGANPDGPEHDAAAADIAALTAALLSLAETTPGPADPVR